MNIYFLYLIKSSVCLALFYFAYRVFLSKQTHFAIGRIFLLVSIILAVALPFNQEQIQIDNLQNETNLVNVQYVKLELTKISDMKNTENQHLVLTTQVPESKKNDWFVMLQFAYISITFVFLLKLFIDLINLFFIYQKSEKIRFGRFRIIYLKKGTESFSFLNCIFVNKYEKSETEIKKIITHEIIHARNFHTIDLLVIELLRALMWFNPAIWMVRNSMQQIHEFQADEGVLKLGFDRLQYQALLINQAAEDRLISISSNFSYSLIKKRIGMMTKPKSNGRTKLRIFTLLPLTFILFFAISVVNGKTAEKLTGITGLDFISKSFDRVFIPEKKIVKNIKNEQAKKKTIVEEDSTLPKIVAQDTIKDFIAAVAVNNLNVLYVGIPNPITIAVSELKKEEVNVEVDNGKFVGENGKYIIYPSVKGELTLSIFAIDKNGIKTEIKKQKFRVKEIPDPEAFVGKYRDGSSITKSKISKLDIVTATIINFEIDVECKVLSFTVSTVLDGFVEEKKSHDDKFTNKQIDLINKLEVGKKFYIEDIMVKMSDGTIRKINSLMFRIIEDTN